MPWLWLSSRRRTSRRSWPTERQAPTDAAVFDSWDPANISPLVAYLSTADCPLTGRVFFVQGGTVRNFQNWTMTEGLEKNDRWTVAELTQEMAKFAG